ncbi:MAG TPA: hypothetical protein V6D20_02155, partial [Candidatus Obscuribacterales bacterium]
MLSPYRQPNRMKVPPSSDSYWLPGPSHQVLHNIQQALAWKPPPRTRPPFQFDLSEAAALHNQQVLASFDFDLEKVLLSDSHS